MTLQQRKTLEYYQIRNWSDLKRRRAAFAEANQLGAMMPPISGLGGLGDSQTITRAVGAGLISAGSILAASGVGALPGAIVAAVGALTTLIGGLFQPDLTKIQATHIVDQIELQVLKPMLANWQALPASQKTQTMQAAYLEVFDSAWRKVQEGCSNPALGSAGQACIADRIRGGKFPWPVYYRDPIALDPNVIPDSLGGSITSGASGFVDSISSGLGVSPLVIGLGLIGLAFVAVSD